VNGAKGFTIYPRQNRIHFGGGTGKPKVPESCCINPKNPTAVQSCVVDPTNPSQVFQDVSLLYYCLTKY